jgi:acetyltransferase-like isoleucine patch superfamily enzyme
MLSTIPAGDRPWLVLGIGSIAARRAVIGRLGQVAAWATVVHASAWVSPTAVLVEHDVRLGSFAHVAPGAVVGGATRVGDGAFVGLGAMVRDHVRIGDGAVVGMGAVVTQDVAAGASVVGSPARPRDGAR